MHDQNVEDVAPSVTARDPCRRTAFCVETRIGSRLGRRSRAPACSRRRRTSRPVSTPIIPPAPARLSTTTVAPVLRQASARSCASAHRSRRLPEKHDEADRPGRPALWRARECGRHNIAIRFATIFFSTTASPSSALHAAGVMARHCTVTADRLPREPGPFRSFLPRPVTHWSP